MKHVELNKFRETIVLRLEIAPSAERAHLKTLMRRLDFLAERYAQQLEPRHNDFDRREMAALAWAINKLDDEVPERPRCKGKFNGNQCVLEHNHKGAHRGSSQCQSKDPETGVQCELWQVITKLLSTKERLKELS